MRIFVKSIFKCKRCTFDSKIKLVIKSTKMLETDYNISIIEKYLETEDCYELLKSLQPQFEFLSDNDIQNRVGNENVRKIMFEIDVVEGYLECMNCKLIYPIKDSILDTVDCIEQ